MRIIVAGSRSFNDYEYAKTVLQLIDNITTIVSGTARGADKLGERFARENNIPLVQYPADWDRYGKSAGYRRNEKMAQNADGLVAFWDGESRGTKHMIDLAIKYNLKRQVIII